MKKKFILGLLALIVMGGAGGAIAWKKSEDAKERARLAKQREEEKAARDQYESQLRDYNFALTDREDFETCRKQTGPLIRSLENLSSRLTVGVNYSAYGELVGQVAIRYDRVKKGRLSSECEDDVMEQGRKAYNAFWRANQQWDDCLFPEGSFSFSCSIDDIESDLQKKWRTADRLTKRMKRELREMRVPVPEKPTPPK